MFEVGDKIRVINKICRKDYDTLTENNIRPGTKGEITSILLTIKIDGKEIVLNENSVNIVEYVQDQYKSSSNSSDESVNFLKNMFGMK